MTTEVQALSPTDEQRDGPLVEIVSASQLLRFIGIGVVSTVAYALLYLVFRDWLSAGAANALALALTAIGNTAANRRHTFGVRGRDGLMRHHLLGALVFLLALGLTSGALATLHALDPRPAHLLEVVVLIVASAAATLTRYVCLRWFVFRQDEERAPATVIPWPLERTTAGGHADAR